MRRVKVLDFGLARAADGTDGVSASGQVVGTPAYMAPEQAAGRAVDARADLFSLGAILYRLAAGRPAFTGPTVTAVLTAIATHHPPSVVTLNPAIQPPLSALIDRLLAKDPGQRPASAAEVADTLAAIETGQPVVTPVAKPRSRLPVVAAAVLLLSCIGAGIWFATRPAENVTVPPAPKGVDPVVAATPTKYTVRVDVLVERNKRLVRLDRPGALPLKVDDGFAINATVEPPAYLYVVWVDPGHDVTPVYPWNPEVGWGSRPQREEPTGGVRLPRAGEVYYAPEAKPGVATIVAFAPGDPARCAGRGRAGVVRGAPGTRPGAGTTRGRRCGSRTTGNSTTPTTGGRSARRHGVTRSPTGRVGCPGPWGTGRPVTRRSASPATGRK